MSRMKGVITDIKRFAVHDGDGIRTTVFLKGCPLKCIWCHNPEGISSGPALAYFAHKCTACGKCTQVCSAHQLKNGRHIFLRQACTPCERCSNVCPNAALKLYGKTVTVNEVLSITLEDRIFYEASGGGVTLSGGECLLQPDFCAALLKALKENGIHTAVDTCGFVSRQAIDKVLPFTDIFLYDIKAVDEALHLQLTGQSNRLILENLNYISRQGKKLEIRIPYVPGCNENQIPKIKELLKALDGITKVRVLPYHNLAGSKYTALGLENTLPKVLPSPQEILTAEHTLKLHENKDKEC